MKILVVMKNWLGDLLFQMPALEQIHQCYPNAAITCVAPERCREILEAHPAVSGFLSFDEKSTHRSWFDRFRFLWELQKAGPWDEGYLFHRSRSRAFLLMLAGVKKRIGYGRGRGFFLTKAIPEPAQPMHQLDYFLNLVQAAGFQTPPEHVYRFFFKEEDKLEAEGILKGFGIEKGTRYICFHLGANWEPKRWPVGHFALLADMIHEKWHIPVAVTGSQQDEPLFEEFKGQVQQAKIIPLVGKTSLRVAAAIFQSSACVVTGDSGPMHIASGVGASVVAIFGPTDPNLTGPRGIGDKIVLQYVPEDYQVPWYGGHLPPEGWLSHITPEQVFNAIERIYPKSYG